MKKLICDKCGTERVGEVAKDIKPYKLISETTFSIQVDLCDGCKDLIVGYIRTKVTV